MVTKAFSSVLLRILLPLMQVLLAIAVMLYAPYEYRIAMQNAHAYGNSEWRAKHSPPPSERIASAINFPAMTLNYPSRNWGRTVYQHTYIILAVHDFTYVVWIAVFWTWLGRQVDQRLARSWMKNYSRCLAVIESSLGIILGLLCAAYALSMLVSSDRSAPLAEIAVGGLVWAALLIVLFGGYVVRRQG